MRVIAGEARGRRLLSPRGKGVRPSSDKVREALFQILAIRMGGSFDGVRVLDLFAGTGALGIEALSRGAQSVVFVDNDRSSLDLVVRNLEHCSMKDRTRLVQADLTRRSRRLLSVLSPGCFELVLADPPYSQGLGAAALRFIAGTCALSDDGWMVVEEASKEVLPESVQAVKEGGEEQGGCGLHLAETRTYGGTKLWFYRRGDHV